MNWKKTLIEFIRPTKRKVILFIILFLFGPFINLYVTCVQVFPIEQICSPRIFPFGFIVYFIVLIDASLTPLFILIEMFFLQLILSYLLSCIISKIIDLIKKKKLFGLRR